MTRTLTTASQTLTLNVDGTAFAFEDADSKAATSRRLEQFRTELEQQETASPSR